jgi:hypothetical protein
MMLRRTLIQWPSKQADLAAFTLERREQNRCDEERFFNSPRTRMQTRRKRLQAAYLQALWMTVCSAEEVHL